MKINCINCGMNNSRDKCIIEEIFGRKKTRAIECPYFIPIDARTITDQRRNKK